MKEEQTQERIKQGREALGNDDGRVESFIDPGGKES